MPLIRRNVTIRRSRAASWARLAGGLALPVLALGVIGMRVGLVPQLALQPVLVAGFALGLVALGLAVYSLVDIWGSGAEGAGSAIVGIVYASPVLVILGAVVAAAVVYPRLSDVVTDVDDPPRFTIPEAPRQPPSPESIARQVAAYPEIASHLYPLPIGDVLVAARKIIDAKHWKVTREVRPAQLPTTTPAASAPQVVPEDDELTRALAAKSEMTQSRGGMATETLPTEEPQDATAAEAEPSNVAILEAIAPTPIFGFLDDVVVRLEITDDGGTQVDMRSASRIGAHDLGENARRIKGFFELLDAALQPPPGAPGVASASQ